jgi:molybdopterin-guanine dinucleotide biosynthesis protein A
MGRDKAFVNVAGRPLAVIAADALTGAGAVEVLAVGGDGAALRALGLEPVPDLHPGAGPLGGVITALERAVGEWVVVLACDLPHVTAAAVAAVAAARGDDIDAVVPTDDDHTHVLLAAYRRSCLVPFTAALAEGERSLRRALAPLAVRTLTLDDPRWAWNANRPEDLDQT